MSLSTDPTLSKKPDWSSTEIKKAADEFIDHAANVSKKAIDNAANSSKQVTRGAIDATTSSLESLKPKGSCKNNSYK